MRVYSAANPTEAYLVSELLRQQNIACEVRGDALFSVKGELPLTQETDPFVWIFNEQQLEKARGIVREFTSQQLDTSQPSWQCAHCGEDNEPQFGACWSCGELES